MHTHKRNLSGGILILSLTHFSPAIFEGIDHQLSLSLSLSDSDALHKLFSLFIPLSLSLSHTKIKVFHTQSYLPTYVLSQTP